MEESTKYDVKEVAFFRNEIKDKLHAFLEMDSRYIYYKEVICKKDMKI